MGLFSGPAGVPGREGAGGCVLGSSLLPRGWAGVQASLQGGSASAQPEAPLFLSGAGYSVVTVGFTCGISSFLLCVTCRKVAWGPQAPPGPSQLWGLPVPGACLAFSFSAEVSLCVCSQPAVHKPLAVLRSLWGRRDAGGIVGLPPPARQSLCSAPAGGPHAHMCLRLSASTPQF